MQDKNKEMRMVLYHSENDDVSVNALIKDETLWITQKAMAELFDVQIPAISKHLKNIFSEGELDEEVVVSKMETTTQHGAIEGKTQTTLTNFYNLDAIISVGYRVNSKRATAFRIWATGILKEYMTKDEDNDCMIIYISISDLTEALSQNACQKFTVAEN